MATMTFGDNPMVQSNYERFMENWRHVINVSERTLIDNVAATVPWLAPVSPAYMAWNNAVTLLGWPVWVAWVVAMAIEGLGLSVISTAFQLWKDKRSTFWVAVGTAVFYLAVVIVVNIGLELGWAAWIAKALLSLLSVPAAVTIALRSQNAQIVEQETVKAALLADEQIQAEERARAEKLAEEQLASAAKIADEEREYQRIVDEEERERKYQLKLLKLQKKVDEKPAQVSESAVKVSNFPETFGKWQRWPQVPDEQRRRIASMMVQQVVEEFGVDERNAYNWIKYAKKATEVSHV
jgi:hypothetical protein